MLIEAYGKFWVESVDYKTLPLACASHILISTTSDRKGTNLSYVKGNPYIVDILEVNYDDLDGECVTYFANDVNSERFIIFNENHAKEILAFVNKNITNPNLSAIITHCDAGVSRSKGMAAALSKILNEEDDKYFKTGVPNRLVYSTILKEYYTNTALYKNMENYYIKNCVTGKYDEIF